MLGWVGGHGNGSLPPVLWVDTAGHTRSRHPNSRSVFRFQSSRTSPREPSPRFACARNANRHPNPCNSKNPCTSPPKMLFPIATSNRPTINATQAVHVQRGITGRVCPDHSNVTPGNYETLIRRKGRNPLPLNYLLSGRTPLFANVFRSRTSLSGLILNSCIDIQSLATIDLYSAISASFHCSLTREVSFPFRSPGSNLLINARHFFSLWLRYRIRERGLQFSFWYVTAFRVSANASSS